MKIFDDNQYREALERANNLRSAGASVDENSELAELEAAIANYDVIDGGPGGSKNWSES